MFHDAAVHCRSTPRTRSGVALFCQDRKLTCPYTDRLPYGPYRLVKVRQAENRRLGEVDFLGNAKTEGSKPYHDVSLLVEARCVTYER